MRYLVTRDLEEAGGQVCVWKEKTQITLVLAGCYVRDTQEEEPPLLQLSHGEFRGLYKENLCHGEKRIMNLVVDWLYGGEEMNVDNEKMALLREALEAFSGPKGVCSTLEKVKKRHKKALKLVDDMAEYIEHLEDTLDDVEFCLSAALNGEEEDE